MSAIVVLEVNPNAIPRALLTILLLDKLKEAKSLFCKQTPVLSA